MARSLLFRQGGQSIKARSKSKPSSWYLLLCLETNPTNELISACFKDASKSSCGSTLVRCGHLGLVRGLGKFPAVPQSEAKDSTRSK